MATDPICGMYVDERSADLALVRDNRSYYFCSSGCLEEFARPEAQLARLRTRLWVAWPTAIVVLVLAYAVTGAPARFLEWGLASVVQFYPGLTFYRGTRDAIRSRMWNMDVLIAVGTTVAYAYSAAVLLLPGRLPVALFFDASSLIITLILSGNYLEHQTRHRAAGALRRLEELLPATVTVVGSDGDVERALSDVHEGDRVRVRPGGRFPVDGRIESGRTAVDESLVTGESLPVPKGPGSSVLAGSVNGDGAVVVVADHLGSDTLLAEIGRLLADSEMSQVPLKQTADRIAERFVPFVLILATGAGVAWFLFGAGFTLALLVFVSVAIAACPCAFGIATPAAILVGTGSAAESGVLFRGRDALEKAARVDTVVLDKTGTLTAGTPQVTRVVPAEGVDERTVLALAAGLESSSEHPLARAVLARAREIGIAPLAVTEMRADPGVGVTGRVGGSEVAVTRAGDDQRAERAPRPIPEAASAAARDGQSVSIVRRDGHAIGLLAFSDPPRPEARTAVRGLVDSGIRVVLASGDHPEAVASVARAVGIAEAHAGLSPKAKLDLLSELQRSGCTVAFVGDGINDAPALAAADLGIALGTGTDVAKEAGQVLLIRPDLRGVRVALTAGRGTVRKVRQNLEWAIGYNLVLLPVTAGVLVPFLGLGIYSVLPMVGALAMGLSSTSVVLNSLTLRGWIAAHAAPPEPAVGGSVPGLSKG